MGKKKVSVEEFYRIWNEALRRHPEYVEGTSIRPLEGGAWVVDSPNNDVRDDDAAVQKTMIDVSEAYYFDC